MVVKNKLLILILSIYILSIFSFNKIALAANEPKVNGKSAILIELSTGEILWSKNENQKLPPASTTKVLTALIALEKGKLDDWVTISENAVKVQGTTVYLEAGEQMQLEDLLYAMLLNSANDAAYAVAEHIGGTIQDFAKLMNERAKKMGTVNSNFVNPHGLTDEGHYTTAKDLALISKEAMKNTTFRKIVATKERLFQSRKFKTQLINGNKLLNEYKGTIGIKNGFTTPAKNCLVSASTREKNTFLTVVLGSNDVYNESKNILDYGFNNYYLETFITKGEKVVDLNIADQKLEVEAVSDLTILQSKENPKKTVKSVSINNLELPIKKGTKLGTVSFWSNEKEIGKIELLAKNELINKLTVSDYYNIVCRYLVTGCFILLVLRILIKRSRIKRKKRRIFT